jgi:hypothetical protein
VIKCDLCKLLWLFSPFGPILWGFSDPFVKTTKNKTMEIHAKNTDITRRRILPPLQPPSGLKRSSGLGVEHRTGEYRRGSYGCPRYPVVYFHVSTFRSKRRCRWHKSLYCERLKRSASTPSSPMPVSSKPKCNMQAVFP